ncbi:peptidylprolyl isomerase [Ancylomarina longa]|uniref:Peptidyl-prolyl cis-trans isomerase n=1 Tax=Ancylomarina longa TaxID=2487017 RepID=A0A434AFH3_9BACT|nr:peptidylprolyl isomerase [Ancylomarina longa]RUT73161.1 peptidylprolyl isomerase [Ancylomarina longa]
MKYLIFIVFLFLLASCQQNSKIGTKNRIIEIETDYGDMTIRLYDETPKHRDNFIKLASQNYYNGTLFHRVINGFMIQGGDPDSKGSKPGQHLGEGGPGYQIAAEINPKFFHKKGVIAAARESDDVNPEKKSAGSQFYIAQGKVYTKGALDSVQMQLNSRLKSKIFNQIQRENVEALTKSQTDGDMNKMTEIVDRIQNEVDSIFNSSKIEFTKDQIEVYTTVGGIPHLDGNYTVFGEVVKGMDVIDKIAAVEKDDFDRPIKDVEMKVKILK